MDDLCARFGKRQRNFKKNMTLEISHSGGIPREVGMFFMAFVYRRAMHSFLIGDICEPVADYLEEDIRNAKNTTRP